MAIVPFLHAVSNVTQTITTANTPQKVDIDTQIMINDMALDTATDEVTIAEDGIYYVSITAQVGREDSCADDIPNLRFFVKNNGADILSSGSFINVNRHRETKGTYTKDYLLDLSVDDVLSFWVSSSVDALTKLEHIVQAGEPDIPAFNLVILKLSQDGESDCL